MSDLTAESTAPYLAADGLVRVYPATDPNGTGLVWAHGGGFLFGDIDMPEGDWVAQQLAARGTTVVSVDYRLAPKPEDFHPGVKEEPGHIYPAGSDDMVSAIRWMRAHAGDLGIRPDAIAVGGASAGANLATGAALRLAGTDEGVALAVLAYPTLHAIQGEPSAETLAVLDADADRGGFPPDVILNMYENYLGGPVENAPLPAVPGLATASELADFPPTIIVNSEVDGLRPSGEQFAATLKDAGRDVQVHTEIGTRHGHLNRPEEDAAGLTIERFATRIAALVA
ncbi:MULTISPECIES: alpha/beta hydrolase [unclassified Microbacterium]|uniref:alpha/beta hydrolase n=1 Tax=unclassified Microbacterium TaxID=2609290 RepID=UPI0012FB91DF|nr:alpha/beta hydrolase fold domain-containing protein [Microbacterium sp. MAH-37]MVQ42901.1 alpha/beta hydrolase fold domain-containing protein [Microbacterium sp. MAH-37]